MDINNTRRRERKTGGESVCETERERERQERKREKRQRERIVSMEARQWKSVAKRGGGGARRDTPPGAPWTLGKSPVTAGVRALALLMSAPNPLA